MPARWFDLLLRRFRASLQFGLAALILLFLVSPVIPGSSPLYAQEDSSPVDLAIEGLSNWGPLYWKPRIALKDMGYDNNLYLADEEPAGSFTATLTPGIDLFLPVGDRQLFSVTEDLDLVYYAENPPGFYMNNNASVAYDLYLKRAHLSLGDEFTTKLQRPNEEIDARVRRLSNLIYGELMLDITSLIQAGLTHESDKISYDDETIEEPGAPDDLAQVLDRTERQNGLLLRYAALSRTSFLLKVRHTDYDFKDPESTRESYEMRYLVGAEFDPTGILNGELEVGYSSFTADLAPDQDFNGLVGNGRVTWRTMAWLHFRVTAVQDRRFSTYKTNLFYVRKGMEGRVSLRLRSLGWLDLGYGWDRSEYPVEDVNTGTSEDPLYVSREDRFTNPILGFRYQPRPGVVVGIEAKYRSRTSNYTRDYDRLFIAVSVSLTK